jgi:hypothetical protein
MAQPTPPLYALDPALPVLLRPDGAVQVGWSPRRAVLVRPPRGLTSAGVATLLRTMHSPVPMSELQRQADRQGGVAAGELGDLVAQLVAAGVTTRGRKATAGALRMSRLASGPVAPVARGVKSIRTLSTGCAPHHQWRNRSEGRISHQPTSFSARCITHQITRPERNLCENSEKLGILVLFFTF